MDGKWWDALPFIAKEEYGKALLAIYISAKDILPALNY